MIKVDGDYYFLDLDALSNELEQDGNLAEGTIKETEEITTMDGEGKPKEITVSVITKHKPKEIDGSKYELLRTMVEILLSVEFEYDEALMKSKDLQTAPMNYAIAFNTLLKLKILKKL
jgi:hypothetical protein